MNLGGTRRRAARLARLLFAVLAAACTDQDRPALGDERTGCSTEQRRAALRALQAEVLALAPRELASLDEATRPGGPLAGWRLAHGHVVLAGAGGVGVDRIGVAPPMPPLLLYAPSPASSPADWLDFDEPDGPYRLVGWAYIGPFAEGSQPPHRPCVSPDEWLVHEAGWHLMDGGMLLTPGATSEPPRPDAAVFFWHPRAWDLHVWAGEDGVPTIAYQNPNARPGGLALPAGSFLRREGGVLRPIS